MIRVAKPSAALEPFVHSYVHFEMNLSACAARQSVLARTAPVIEFTFGDPYSVWVEERACCEAAQPVALIGAQTYRRVALEMHRHVETFVIVFQPGGLSHLFSMRADVLTDRHFEGAAVVGGSVNALWLRLAESTSFAERVRVAEHYLLRLPGTATSPSAVTMAARELLRVGGALRIHDLASAAGFGVRQFERKFGAQIGLAPKVFARVARFEAALQHKRRMPELRWTDIAHELGYHDQSHMVHEFRELAGSTPLQLAAQVDLFVDPHPPN